MSFAVGVLDDLRMMDFDFDAVYLQGHYVDRRVFAPPRSSCASTTNVASSTCGNCSAHYTAAPTLVAYGTTRSHTT